MMVFKPAVMVAVRVDLLLVFVLFRFSRPV